ncbi:MAG: hypothetical protein AAF634_06830, partial [Bacteroidota bacterium]
MKKILLLFTVITLGCKQVPEVPLKTENKLMAIDSIQLRNLKPDGSPYTHAELQNMDHNKLMHILYEPPRDTILTIGILLY